MKVQKDRGTTKTKQNKRPKETVKRSSETKNTDGKPTSPERLPKQGSRLDMTGKKLQLAVDSLGPEMCHPRLPVSTSSSKGMVA